MSGPPTSGHPHPRPRNQSVDIVKGMAITLVVFGHTLQGLAHRGLWNTPASSLLDRFIYSFHMPAFFFVSGLFVGRSLMRLTPFQFLSEKSRTILYPYLLWVVISLVQQPIIGRFKSGSATIDPLTYFKQVATGDQGWFLECLFLSMVMTLLTSRLPDWLRVSIAVLICIATPPLAISAIDQLAREWAFLAVGQLIGARISALGNLKRPHAAAALILLLVAQLAAVAYLQPAFAEHFLRARMLFLFLGLSGTAGLLCVAQLIAGTRLAVAAAWTGVASIAIYLLHPYFQGIMRQAVYKALHTQRPLPHLMLTTAFATLMPALIWHLRLRLHIAWLFRLGHEDSNKRATTAMSEKAA